jgi:3-carboxy-cis,cis-muconate cycloisomerase
MSTSLSPLLAPMLSSAAMRSVCDDLAYLQNMLDFEQALASAEAAVGVIPQTAADPIGKACKAESFDLTALAETRSGNLAIPLVKALTANVAKIDADAARYVHWGATSQDVIDTAAMLGLRAAINAPPSSRAPGCSMRCRCHSGSSLRNMPRPCTARASG